MADPEPVIHVGDLTKTYRDGVFRRRKIEALAGVSFEVGRGEIFGLLGPNGAGKTTMIKVLLGIVRKTSGTASMLGCPAGHRAARRQVGYLPEGHRIPRHLTGNSALEYYGSLSGLSVSETARRRPELLKMVGLEDWGKTLVTKYSKGMQQRLGLAQAMLHEPDLLILDEPTDGVDPVGRAEIRNVLNELKDQGKTIFLNSHLLQEVELVCNRVAILNHGKLLRVGPVEELTEITSSTDVEEADVTLELEGPSEAIMEVLPKTARHHIGDNDARSRVTIPGIDQETLDGIVDQLRVRNVSLLALSRERQTLEEAFLTVVRTAEADS